MKFDKMIDYDEIQIIWEDEKNCCGKAQASPNSDGKMDIFSKYSAEVLEISKTVRCSILLTT